MHLISRRSQNSSESDDSTASSALARLFEAMVVVVDQERFLIQATRLPWFRRTREELEISAEGVGAAQSKVGITGVPS